MAALYTKTIMCFANSRKVDGRSVAGKELSDNGIAGWIRPVSVRPGGDLLDEDRRLQDGKDPSPLDVISIAMIEARPSGYHVENHLIDDTRRWVKERRASWSDLQAALDPVAGPLWDNSSSSYNGIHDRIEETAARSLGGSLRLIKVNDFKIVVGVEGAEIGRAKQKVRGYFTFNDMPYLLAVTDPVIEGKYLGGSDGEFRIGSAALCIGLREPYRGYAYKLIASVIPEI